MCQTNAHYKESQEMAFHLKKWEQILTLLQEGPLAVKDLWDSYSAGMHFSQILIWAQDNLIKFIHKE